MDNNEVIDDHLLYNPTEGLGKLHQLIRFIGVLGVIAAILNVIGVFQDLYYLGQNIYQIMKNQSFDKYIAYDLSGVFFNGLHLILEVILAIFFFRFGLVAINAGKKAFEQKEWDSLFKDLKTIFILSLVFSVTTLLFYFINLFIGFII